MYVFPKLPATLSIPDLPSLVVQTGSPPGERARGCPECSGDPGVTRQCVWGLEERSQLYQLINSVALGQKLFTYPPWALLCAGHDTQGWGWEGGGGPTSPKGRGESLGASQASLSCKDLSPHLANRLDRLPPRISQGFVRNKGDALQTSRLLHPQSRGSRLHLAD